MIQPIKSTAKSPVAFGGKQAFIWGKPNPEQDRYDTEIQQFLAQTLRPKGEKLQPYAGNINPAVLPFLEKWLVTYNQQNNTYNLTYVVRDLQEQWARFPNESQETLRRVLLRAAKDVAATMNNNRGNQMAERLFEFTLDLHQEMIQRPDRFQDNDAFNQLAVETTFREGQGLALREFVAENHLQEYIRSAIQAERSAPIPKRK